MADRHNEVHRTIDAPPDRVWALLTDGSGFASWNPTVISLDGRIEEGNTIELVSTLNPKRTFKLKVAEMRPPTTMRWSDGMPLGLFQGVRTYQLDARDGGTSFTMTEDYSGLLAGLIRRSIPDLAESFDQFADGLKEAAENP